jgi:hypothetical protein
MAQVGLVEDAIAFVLSAYERAGDLESADHSLEVATLLAEAGAGSTVVTAGVLHDVVEDSGTSIHELRDRFGSEVADIVSALTEDPGIRDPAERKRSLRESVAGAGPAAQEVFIADKLARLRAADREGATPEPAKLDHYGRSWRMLAASIEGSGYLDEVGARLDELGVVPVGRATTSKRGERLRDAAHASRAASAGLSEESRAVIAQARQAVAHALRRRRERQR